MRTGFAGRRRLGWALVPACFLLLSGSAASSPAARPDPPRAVADAIAALAATTVPGGGGPAAYEALLAEDFSRWTLGRGPLNGREAWIEGVREWWVAGWRVDARTTERVDIDLRGDQAFVRRIVEEVYRGPDGERSTAVVALSEVWVRVGREWRLWRVDAHPLDG